MKIIVGLGNPGKKYEDTKHNLGFMFLDFLKDKYRFNINKEKFNSLIGESVINDEKYIFVKPLTYMNLSGNAVKQVLNYYNTDDILIVYDDIDIEFGTIRYREKGSGGTHNGMKNILELNKDINFRRIRIGLGNLKHEKQDLASFVLERFNKEQKDKLKEIFEKVENTLFEMN